MPHPDDAVLRVLIVHREEETRDAVEQSLRRVYPEAMACYQASSPSEGLLLTRQLDPRCVLLDLASQQEMAFELAREIRDPGRLVIGLINTLISQHNDVTFLRRAVRAGVGDFVPVPVSDAELAEAVVTLSDRASRRAAGRTVAFISQRGGVGTTALAVNSALLLAAEAAPGGAVLCDGAVQFGCAAGTLGLAPDQDLADLVLDLDRVESLAAYVEREPETGLHLLAAPRDPHQAERVTPEDLSRVLTLLRRQFDVVVVDLPPALDLLTLSALDLCDTIVVVTEALATTILGTARFLGLLESQGFDRDRLRVVVNRYLAEVNLPREVIGQELGREPDAVVSYDQAVVMAENQGQPPVLSAPGGGFAGEVRGMVDVLLRGEAPHRAGVSGRKGLAVGDAR